MPVPDIIPSRGAIATPLVLEVTREITAEDILRLGSAAKTNVPILQKLHATHHRQAQLLAQGRSISEVAMIVGCTPQRLVQLQVDPTFAELVHCYHDQIMVAMISDGARLADKIVDVGEMAVDEMRERLQDDELRAKIPLGEIRKIAEFAMDRTVAPVKSAPPSAIPPIAVTMNFGTSLRPTDKQSGLVITEEGKTLSADDADVGPGGA